MSAEAEQSAPAPDAAEPVERSAGDAAAAAAKKEERAQRAWATRRDLDAHAPESMQFEGTSNGVVAGLIVGDVITGGKTEINYLFGDTGASQASGEIPETTLNRLAGTFVAEGTPFDALLERLREEHVLVLKGAPFTGRRTAALMLLHRLGATPVHVLDRAISPGDFSRQFTKPGKARGHVLCDLAIPRDQPLREAHLLALRSRMKEQQGYLVITTGHSPYIESDVRPDTWSPPTAEAVLSERLHRHAGKEVADRLLALPAVGEFLARDHQVREASAYATLLIQYAQGAADVSQVDRYSLHRLELQIREWFEEAETTLHLREKAFLIALATFDGGPYALTAELSDLLYSELRRTGDPEYNERIPVFGTHIGKRLQEARADIRQASEETEWGPVTQLTAFFKDNRTSPVLLREVWTGHPSARPAIVSWLGKLAKDGRPLVRTRAAATVAVLAYTDLPSAMALIIEPWALSAQARQRTTAVSALTLAHRIGAPNIPRIIDGWSTDTDEPQRCWVAIRAQGLIGPERPEKALAALRTQARQQSSQATRDQMVAEEIPQSVALLLLSPKGDEILTDLLRTLHAHRSAFELAVQGFLAACFHNSDDAEHRLPPVLDWYTCAARSGAETAPHIALLMRTALDDVQFTSSAADVLRRWILAADQDEATEWALAHLLRALVTSPREHARLDYLLRKPQGEDGGPYPAVAGRLRTALPFIETV
ncbi:hypothetical protein MTF65_18965 [Streptomyces sp. APSN-46.1]|uniref:hypothetical protein n=1 Tax=Streptomyces sp. APSN-46.1 TaxID=2929049 RepID=UPI001FB484C8|nr:hypothetical protein [Streptomyces sp. APSN-46.1]MCJ1679382.1 hypothetical protein [Streptomyces sp. APSN-46.1]